MTEPCQDPVVEAVVGKLRRRSAFGLDKYGVTLARTDTERRQWLQLALEEALDLANYLQRMIMELDGTLQTSSASPGAHVPDRPVGQLCPVTGEACPNQEYWS